MHSVARIVGIAALVAVAGLWGGQAQAGDWYLGAAYVQSELEARDLDVEFDADDKGLAFFAGRNINRFFALEAAYTDLGSPTAQSMGFLFNSDVKAYSLSLLANIPLGRRLDIIGRGGYARWDIETTVDNGVVQGGGSDSDYDFSYGAGLRVKLTPKFALRANYDLFEIEAAENVQTASLGAEIRF